MVFSGIFALFRFVTLIYYSAYDMKCVIFEQASVINCHQGAVISHENAKIWILFWVFSSISGSVVFLTIVFYDHELLNFQHDKAKKIWKKGSFLSVLWLCLIATGFHAYRISLAASVLGKIISASMVLWMIAMFLDLLCLNYTPRVHWRGKFCDQNCWDSFRNNICCLFYWISLIMFFLEALYLWIAVALDVAHQVAPLIEKEYPDEPRIKGIIVLGLGFNLAFHSNLVSFFWNKIFHGDKDLLSEPCSKLIQADLQGQARNASSDQEEQARHTPIYQEEQAGHTSTDQGEQAGHTSTNQGEQAGHTSTDQGEQAGHTSTDQGEQAGHTSTDQGEQAGHTSTDQGEQAGHTSTDQGEQAGHTSTDQGEQAGHTSTDQGEQAGHTSTDQGEQAGHTSTDQGEQAGHTSTNQEEQTGHPSTHEVEQARRTSTDKEKETPDAPTEREKQTPDIIELAFINVGVSSEKAD